MQVFRADQFDCPPGELDRARGGADVAGELGCPGAELCKVGLHKLGRVRHGLPQRERPLDVRQCFSQAEHRLSLAGRFDGGDERLCRAARMLPAVCQVKASSD